MGAVLTWEVAPAALVGASRRTGYSIGVEAINAVDPACPRDGSVAIYFAVDVEVSLDAIGTCDEAFRGLNDACAPAFKVKVYGEGALIDHLVGGGLVVGKQWLSASTSYPGYAPQDTDVCIVQQVGTDVPNTDRNLVTDPYAVDAWWPVGSPYGGDDMPLSEQDIAAVAQAVKDAIGDELANAVWAGRDGIGRGRFTQPWPGWLDGRGVTGRLNELEAKVDALTAALAKAGVPLPPS
jgi:hypothetical protein